MQHKMLTLEKNNDSVNQFKHSASSAFWEQMNGNSVWLAKSLRNRDQEQDAIAQFCN
jgi:hypothetical protein